MNAGIVADIQTFGFPEGFQGDVFEDGVRLRVYPVNLEDSIEISAYVLDDLDVV